MPDRKDGSFHSIGYAIALPLIVLPLLEFTLTIRGTADTLVHASART